jgi:hypothetical protein
MKEAIMLVRVMYQNDRFDMVKPSVLAGLISSGKLKKFRRDREWVVVGADPVRGSGGSYEGPERRKNFMQTIKSDFWT